MRLFHATDESCAMSILKQGFKCKNNKSHWLGNGIYFYPDYELANWWATRPTKRFGMKIFKPCILSVELTFLPDHLLDLSSLSGYLDCLEVYARFEEMTPKHLYYEKKYKRDELRCSFFDWVFNVTNVDYIVGNFVHDNQQYLKSAPSESIEQFRLFDLPFAEKQVCVRPGVISPDMIIRC